MLQARYTPPVGEEGTQATSSDPHSARYAISGANIAQEPAKETLLKSLAKDDWGAGGKDDWGTGRISPLSSYTLAMRCPVPT